MTLLLVGLCVGCRLGVQLVLCHFLLRRCWFQERGRVADSNGAYLSVKVWGRFFTRVYPLWGVSACIEWIDSITSSQLGGFGVSGVDLGVSLVFRESTPPPPTDRSPPFSPHCSQVISIIIAESWKASPLPFPLETCLLDIQNRLKD